MDLWFIDEPAQNMKTVLQIFKEIFDEYPPDEPFDPKGCQPVKPVDRFSETIADDAEASIEAEVLEPLNPFHNFTPDALQQINSGKKKKVKRNV